MTLDVLSRRLEATHCVIQISGSYSYMASRLAHVNSREQGDGSVFVTYWFRTWCVVLFSYGPWLVGRGYQLRVAKDTPALG